MKFEVNQIYIQVNFKITIGCSYLYGHYAVKKFLDANHLISVIRAHEA